MQDRLLRESRGHARQLPYGVSLEIESVFAWVARPIGLLLPGTDQGLGASFDSEGSAPCLGLGRSSEMGAHSNASRHAAQCVESGRIRHVAWPSMARTATVVTSQP